MSNRLGTTFVYNDDTLIYWIDVWHISYGLWNKLMHCTSLTYSRDNLPTYLQDYFEGADTNQCFQVTLKDFIQVLQQEPCKQWIAGEPTVAVDLTHSSTEDILDYLGIYNEVRLLAERDTESFVVFDYS
jgi:hypothetical protein